VKQLKKLKNLNPELALQISNYVKKHSYGLVYEQNLPDAIRLYSKKVERGDTVNVLPERGKKEKKDNSITWIVKDVNKDVATLVRNEKIIKKPIDDLVPLVGYKDVIYPGLKEIDRVERGKKNDPYHVVLNSENYHALEALGYAYSGKVDCIYIDPPYNSGAKDWKYNNNYVDDNDQYHHSKWLTFMERRLKIAKQLLNPKDSTLLVTIDEREYSRLGLLLEQLFPEASIQMVSITINPKGAKREKMFARSDEYIYVVLMGDAKVKLQADNTKEKEVRWFYLRCADYASRRGTVKGGLKQFYPIYVDDKTQRIIKIGRELKSGESIEDVENIPGATTVFPIRDDGVEMNWGVTREPLQLLIDQGLIRISKGKKKGKQKYIFKYLSTKFNEKILEGRWAVRGERKDGSKIVVETGGKVSRVTTVWNKKSYDAGQYGTALLKDIIGQGKFSFPKSLYAVEDTLRYFVADKPNALIVDFFAGSGTTLHAVNLLNFEDDGKRRCICITNNEVSSSEADKMTKSGLRQGDPEWEKYGIARYVTWPRTKCSIEGKDINGNELKGDYGVYREEFEIDKDDKVISKSNGKAVKKGIYKKVLKKPYNENLAELKKNQGFKSNAVFYELTYENSWPIRLDQAFNSIAPILWLEAGCRGPVIDKISGGYQVTDYYGVLFDYGKAGIFCKEIKNIGTVKSVFIVTDDQRRYANIVKLLPGINVRRLYEGYLRTFEIYGEGRFD